MPGSLFHLFFLFFGDQGTGPFFLLAALVLSAPAEEGRHHKEQDLGDKADHIGGFACDPQIDHVDHFRPAENGKKQGEHHPHAELFHFHAVFSSVCSAQGPS